MAKNERTIIPGNWSDIYVGIEDQGNARIKTQMVDSAGDDIGVNKPLSVDGDSVYPKDVNVLLSSIGTFADGSQNVIDLFQDVEVSLTDNSSANPKYFDIVLNRPVEATQIGFGCLGGDFSNIVILLKDLSGVVRGTGGDPDNDTKRTSAEYDLLNSTDHSKSVKFGTFRVEFHTADPVCVSYVFLQKDTRVISRIQGIDQDGVVRGAGVTEAGNLRIADFLVEVSRGNIPGYSLERKFGSIGTIQAATPADCWAYGITPGAEVYTFSSSADIDRVSSDNSADTGINITVTGLDVDWIETVQTVALDATDATTPVALPIPLRRVNRTINSNGIDLIGNVYVFVNGSTTGGVPDDAATVRAYVPIGEGGTLQTIYTVPAGITAYVVGIESSLTKSGGATAVTGNYRGRVRVFGGVFRTIDDFDLNSVGTSNRVYNFPIPLPFPEKTDFIANIGVSANGVGGSWAFTMLLIED